MQIEVGNILNGKVASITKFGAFVDFEDGQTGMVHISEVSNDFVEDISQHLKKGDEVKVKVIGINEAGKISLSIKKAMPRPKFPPRQRTNGDESGNNGGNSGNNRPQNNNFNRSQGDRPQRQGGQGGQGSQGGYGRQNRPFQKSQSQNEKPTFEDMMKKFQQSSDEKLSDLKKSTNNKQGSAGYSRRGRQ